MMKRAKLLVAFVSCFLIATLTGALTAEAQYTPSGEGFPLVSPISIISPANSTYDTQALTLNLTVKSFLNPNEADITVSYSIDGETNTTVTPQFTPVPVEAEITTAEGETYTGTSVCSYYLITAYAALPEVPNGAHNITVYARYQLGAHVGLDNATVCFAVDDGASPVAANLSPQNEFSTASPPSPRLSYAVIGAAVIIAAAAAILLLRLGRRKE